MKKRNLFFMSLTMFVILVTLSSWRLFGRDAIESSGVSEVNGVCTEIGTQDSYFFGFNTGSHNMNRSVDCTTGEATGAWVEF